MNTFLSNSSNLPLQQPYNLSPWNYPGTESVSSIPNPNVVDWVLVEIRDAATAASASGATSIGFRAAFLLNNGNIVDLDGTSVLSYSQSINQSLFVVIYHRNHLPVMSASGLNNTGSVYSCDFTSSVSMAYNSGQKEVNGIACIYAANSNASDNIINAFDLFDWESDAGEKGYVPADFNLDIEVNNQDKNDFWLPNQGQGSQVPE
jgi:hypothetical protein